MNCKKCGNKIIENGRFCANCGEPVPVSTSSEKKQEEKLENKTGDVVAENSSAKSYKAGRSNGKSIKKIAVISSACLFLIGGMAIFIIIFLRPMNSFNRAVDKADYKEAAKVYDAADYDTKGDMRIKISDMISECYDGYRTGRLSYDDALDILNGVRSMEIDDIEEQLVVTFAKMEIMRSSKNDYADACAAYEKKDYAAAYNLYNKVIDEDINYDMAKEGAKESRKEYINQILIKAEQYKISKNYADAIALLNDAIQVIGSDEKLEAQIDKCNNLAAQYEIEQIIEQTDAMTEEGRYADAIRTVERTLFGYPENELLTQTAERYRAEYIAYVLAAVEQCKADRDYDTALEMLNVATKIIKDNESIKEQVEVCGSLAVQYAIEQIIVQTDAMTAEGDYEDAIHTVERGLDNYPENELLTQTAEKYRAEYIAYVLSEVERLKADREYESAMELLEAAAPIIGDNESIKEQAEVCRNLYIEANRKVLASVATYSDDGDGMKLDTITEYDIEGRKIKYTYYDASGECISFWEEYSYNAEGKETKHYYYKYLDDGSVGAFSGKETYYDDSGNMVKLSEFETYSEGTYWKYSLYEYDSMGNVIRCTVYNSEGGMIRFNEYEYDYNGNRIKDTRYYADGELYGWEEYAFDSDGNMIKEAYFDKRGNLSYGYEYAFDDRGNKILEVRNGGRNGGLRTEEFEYEYDDNGRIAKKMYYSVAYGASTGTLDIWEEYEYDDDGNMIKTYRYGNNGDLGSWEEYGYDSYGNETFWKYYTVQNGRTYLYGYGRYVNTYYE